MTDLHPPGFPKTAAPYGGMTYPMPELVHGSEDAIDLVALARVLGREWRLIVGLVSVFALLAGGLAFIMTPTYRAEVLLAPVAPPKSDALAAIGPLGDIASLVENFVGGPKDRSAESIATLRSRSLTFDFIREQELKPVLFAERWDASTRTWRRDAPSDLEAYELFDRAIRAVKLDRRTGLVTLSIEWRDPVSAARWANLLVQGVNARRRNEAVHEAQKSIEYLQRQLGRTSSVEVRQAVYRLVEMQAKTIAIAQSREEYAFRVIDKAIPPERHVHPRPLLMIAVAVLAGLAFSVLAVLVKHAVRRYRQAQTQRAAMGQGIA